MERLTRTEISTLIGLACKSDLDTTLPNPSVTQGYIDKTDSLLQEIHQSMMMPTAEIFDPKKIDDLEFDPFKNGSVLRKAIFYGGESAYHFQYRDLSAIKYKKDNEWLINNKGYHLDLEIILVMGAF